MASVTSRVWKAIASSVARAMWAAVVPRVRPRIVPRAAASQCGAPSPVNAGTTTTPPVSGTEAASGSTSCSRSMIPSPSRSQSTAAPLTKTEPSRA